MSAKKLSEALPDGIVVLSESRQLLWWNDLAAQYLGLHAENEGQDIQRIISVDVKIDTVVDIKSPAQYGKSLRLQMQPYYDSQQLLVIKDITHTHHLEAMREDFIANVSHELRTPLTVFHGYIELLEGAKHLNAEKLDDIVLQMSGQCQRMEQLVEDLLLLSRLESDMPDAKNFEIIGVASMLQSIYYNARSFSGDQNHLITLECDDVMQLNGNATELMSAFSNLVYNAVRYTPKQGKIIIRCYENAAGSHVEVEDNGIGIDPIQHEKITQRFYQVDKSRTYKGQGGTGLGLAIVKHVLLRHNGKLEIESELGKGSLFRCSFLA